MSVRTTRLSVGEWLLGISSVLLFVDLFAATWFEYRPLQSHAPIGRLGEHLGASGWRAFDVIGPLALVVCAAGIAICWLAATRRSPAVPVVSATLLAPVSFVMAILIAIRVLLDRPSVHLLHGGGANAVEAKPGAYVGLALSLAIFSGVYLVLRRDGVAPDDSPGVTETLSVEPSRTSAPA